MLAILPSPRRDAVARALTRTFGTPDPESLVPLSGGLSGAGVYRLRIGGIVYLLRLEGPRDVFRDPARWYGCMQIAADAVLAPRVRYANAEDGVAIMEFVDQQPLADYSGSRSDLIVELAQALRVLHEAPSFPVLMPYLDALEMLIGGLRATGLTSHAQIGPVLDRFGDLAAIYRALQQDLVSSHNDLNPRNVLYDGRRLWLVDWESSFLADRYVDLAAVANFFTSDSAGETALMTAYFRAPPTAEQSARMFMARQISLIFYGVSFLTGVAAERPGLTVEGHGEPVRSLADLHGAIGEGTFVLDARQGRLTYGLACLRTAGANLSSPGFAKARKTLA